MEETTKPATAAMAKDYRPWLATMLAGTCAGGVLAAAGGALLFTPAVGTGEGAPHAARAWTLLIVGLIVLFPCGFAAYRRGLCGEQNDCDRYGRHITALTFVLFFVGLCNAVGTSVMALSGGFEVTIEVLLQRVKAATDVRDAADAVRQAQAAVTHEERIHKRAQAEQARACSGQTPDEGNAIEPCRRAAASAQIAAASYLSAQDTLADAKDEHSLAQVARQRNCGECRSALFFLLSLSTVMSLFGALFYVVNSVRMKRPGLPGEPQEGSDSGPTGAGSEGAAQGRALAVQTGERFDPHAFWGGAFFRVGEAVLFTFAFFWLLWTSKMHELLVWLPVFALFLGMFVRTGEAVVFRFGMRLLSGVEAMLPFAATAPAPGSAPRTSVPPAKPGDAKQSERSTREPPQPAAASPS